MYHLTPYLSNLLQCFHVIPSRGGQPGSNALIRLNLTKAVGHLLEPGAPEPGGLKRPFTGKRGRTRHSRDPPTVTFSMQFPARMMARGARISIGTQTQKPARVWKSEETRDDNTDRTEEEIGF